MLKTTAYIFFILFAVIEINAGWVIIEVTTINDSDNIVENTLYIQNNTIKSVDIDHEIIFDLNNWQLTVINNELGGYWMGTPVKYLGFMKESALSYLEEQMKSAGPDEKEMLKVLYDDLKLDMSLDSDVVSFTGELPVEIIMTDNQDRILGYRVNQYRVYVDGLMAEEIWLTRDVKLDDEYDYEKFRAFMDEMSWSGLFQNYRSADSYVHLMKTGMPLRTLEETEGGAVSITEVKSIERKDIAASEFLPPSHFRLMSLADLEFE
ncbi:MAG: DUF4412 domain-containing protein [Bacteroidales bacterium]